MGYRFKNPGLLEAALTHKSCRGLAGDNQRLEFLGDAVLSLAVGHLLMERHPGASEGFLTKKRSALVSGASLAAKAAEIRLSERLRASSRSHQKNPRILADALEAALGAVYLDGGFAKAQKIIARLFDERLKRGVPSEDYKSALQEGLQKMGQAPPVYRIDSVEGPEHKKVFSVEVLAGAKALGKGADAKKKAAEQAAAKAALKKLNIPIA